MTPDQDAPALLAQACEDAEKKIKETPGMARCEAHRAMADGVGTILRCEKVRWLREQSTSDAERATNRERRETILRYAARTVAWCAAVGALILLVKLWEAVHVAQAEVGALTETIKKVIP